MGPLLDRTNLTRGLVVLMNEHHGLSFSEAPSLRRSVASELRVVVSATPTVWKHGAVYGNVCVGDAIVELLAPPSSYRVDDASRVPKVSLLFSSRLQAHHYPLVVSLERDPSVAAAEHAKATAKLEKQRAAKERNEARARTAQ